ncbi:DUF1842 domain-containing protein [Rhizobium lemnae]|uniref:DUF1842 domain-containing protein n=1 Tax=Rhizobium lemnae TaxID=1214924 RepID=A0ABV8EC65_9HYPH|nr:DUF1842 domain-containing protein [Rhizobium lemnae]MCJ8508730.1 DUF1842 domain-containing protein [Rhizobium lemnae]
MTEIHPIEAGLFQLKLQSTGAPGAPTVALTLGVYTPTGKVTGFAEVKQATNPPLDVRSHVLGDLIYETVIGPGSKVRIDLTGYPEIVWPKDGGVGPAIPLNFKAIILLEPDFSKGTIEYQYRKDLTGKWHVVREPIHKLA